MNSKVASLQGTNERGREGGRESVCVRERERERGGACPVYRGVMGVLIEELHFIVGDHSKISLKTKNVLIECTATDLKKVKFSLIHINFLCHLVNFVGTG